MATILAKNVLDLQTVIGIQSILDLPTAIALVAFSVLSVKLELDKPKYRQFQREHGNIDTLLIGGGAAVIAGLVYLKYFM